MAVAIIKKHPVVMVFDGEDAKIFDTDDPEEIKKMDPSKRAQQAIEAIKTIEKASWTIVHHPDEYLTEEEIKIRDAKIAAGVKA